MITIAILELLTAVGLILFWILFFTVGMAPKNPPPGYLAYEHSFPVPDGLLSILLLVAGIMLLLNNPLGVNLSLIAAGALLFLGALDISFNIQNGIYKISTGDLISNAFINLWCVGFGIAIAVVVG
ncbi:MAG: hypothetical protein PHU70_05785 [Dehalococcoidia bacterium]|nr:hypothetical protein [Dehalococcoidia bacterium]MDD5648271.1 hypothetical protein [Dehalococcoidia bacterium]